MEKTLILILILTLFVNMALVSAIFSGETGSFDESQDFTQIDSYSVSGNTSAIPIVIDGLIVNYSIPEDYDSGTFTITLYGWAENKPIVKEESSGDGGCITKLICSEWSGCMQNNTQTRICTKEKSYCYAKPTNLTQGCVYISPIQQNNQTSNSTIKIPSSQTKGTSRDWSFIVIFLIVLMVVLVWIIKWTRREILAKIEDRKA